MKEIPPLRPLLLLMVALFCWPASSAQAAAGWKIIGWNNLGMHCMDDDYAIFSILPPYNTIDAQLINNTGALVRQLPPGLTVTYEAVADPDGSINRTSIGKSNFWNYSEILYGAVLPEESGLAGTSMPGMANTPQSMTWWQAYPAPPAGAPPASPTNCFQGLGIPITPIDDRGFTNTYPLFRIVARDAGNNILAQTQIVLPVSTELNCSSCHASGIGLAAARPLPDWVYDANPRHDFRLNILKLHDQKNAANPAYVAALAQFNFRSTGLYDSVMLDGKSILCAVCHKSEALGTAGAPGTPQLTTSMHGKHALVVDPTGQTMDASTNRAACYLCHPGSSTRCLRGAMGAAVSAADGSMQMQCQSCHGSMSVVGSPTRIGWFQEPNCQSCHTGDALANSGQIRFTSSFDSPGHMRVPTNTRFATNADTPVAGVSLYRFSSGHGGLQCSACHGSTHAEFPSAFRNDNLQSWTMQGHIGKLADCMSCHVTRPNTVTGGPHGMHPIDQTWVNGHHDLIGGNLAQCRVCHGSDYRGTVLSRAQGDHTFTFRSDNTAPVTKIFWRGYQVSCYDCHNGVDTSDPTRKQAPVVPANVALAVSGASASLGLTATGSGPIFRIVQQPMHGTVSLVASTATYYAETGFEGPDYFTYAATESTGYVDSNLGIVSVSVGNGRTNLLKYALGLSMDSSVDPSVLPQIGLENGYLTMTISRSIMPPDVTLTGQASAELLFWDPSAVITVTNTPTLLKIRDTLNSANVPRRFLRLQVLRPQ